MYQQYTQQNQQDYQESQNSSQTVNFHVCVRMKPTNNQCFENSGHVEGQKYVRSGVGNSILLVQPHSTQGDTVFIYDQVFDSKTQTQTIFNTTVRQCLEGSLFKGYSHTILVYGMTGSGKTYTMFGDNFEACTLNGENINAQKKFDGYKDTGYEEDLDVLKQQQQVPINDQEICKTGIVSETIKYVLSQGQNRTKIKISYLEIYNEQIRDLLATDNVNSENLVLLEDPEKGVYCPLLIEKQITSLDQIQQLIKYGNKRRIMASTKMNQFSSRSHAIIILSLEIQIACTGFQTTLVTPKLYMVDLAGSEKAAATQDSKSVRQKEGSNINKSLLSLGNCINILSQQTDKVKKHVPYRDSKLTRLLKESLGGNAKTLFIACVTPAFKFIEETINTLKYAQRAKTIKKEVYENIKEIYHNDQQEIIQKMQVEAEQMKLQQEQQRREQEALMLLQMQMQQEEERRRRQEEELQQQRLLQKQQEEAEKYSFQNEFNKLSQQFEEVLYRGKELEFALKDNIQQKEQNERALHETMDSINPVGMPQKEVKFRLDKVDALQQNVQQLEEIISRLNKEIIDNNQQKKVIKKKLHDLFETKFIEDCQQLTNYHLYNTFEQEKQKLEDKIQNLIESQQQYKQTDRIKAYQIQKLQEELNQLKQSLNKRSDIRSSNCQINIKYSSSLRDPARGVTPKTLSQQQPKNYLQFQTYVPQTQISVQTIRNSFIQQNNQRASKITNRESDINQSPAQREFEEYQRKSFILESQLKMEKGHTDFSNNSPMNVNIANNNNNNNNNRNSVNKSSFKNSYADNDSNNSQNVKKSYCEPQYDNNQNDSNRGSSLSKNGQFQSPNKPVSKFKNNTTQITPQQQYSQVKTISTASKNEQFVSINSNDNNNNNFFNPQQNYNLQQNVYPPAYEQNIEYQNKQQQLPQQLQNPSFNNYLQNNKINDNLLLNNNSPNQQQKVYSVPTTAINLFLK